MSAPETCGTCTCYRRMPLHYAGPVDESGAAKGPLRCARFPTHVDREAGDWCREWSAVDGATVRVAGAKPRTPLAPTRVQT